MKNKKTVYSDIDYWASLIDESIDEQKKYEESCKRFMESKDSDEDIDSEEVDEAGEMFKVDDTYIKKATAALAPLKKTDQSAYDMALKYLDSKKSTNLVMSPEDFAKHRIGLAAKNSDADVDTRTNDQKREDAIKAAADKWKDVGAEKGQKEQTIKSIWVKSLKDDDAELQIEYVDGKTEDVKEDVTVAEDDKYYKQIAQALRAGRRSAKDDRPVTKKDVQLSMICVAYNDARIKWFFGKDKLPQSAWKHTEEVKKQARSKTSELSKGYVSWQSDYGSQAKIYKTK